VRRVHLIWRAKFLLSIFLLSLPLFAKSQTEPGADIFATNAPVLRIKIEMSRSAVNSLNNDSRKYVPATIREGELVLTNVGVHLKGAAGSSRPLGDKPALTLSFGRFNPNQRFHGLRKIHLNNSVQDPSYSTENICSALFDQAGVPAPRATNARVWLNGRDLGFYVLVEGYTKEFLARYFKDTRGNLYDGGFLKDINDTLEKGQGDENNDQADLRKLSAAAQEQDPAKRWKRLQELLDVDRFVNFMALDILLWDWDGYIMKSNNYRVYHDPASGKMVFIPHGMDQMFWEPQGPIFQPSFGGLVARAVVDTPEGNRLYRQRLRKLFEEIYKLDAITNRFDQLHARNKPAVAEIGRQYLNEYESAVAEVRERIIQRWSGIKEQLDREPMPLQFTNGVARLTNWRKQNESEGASLNTVNLEGKTALHIVANGPSMASWRTQTLLDPGHYRFQAKARTAQVMAASDIRGGGAGIRISRSPRKGKLTGDTPWTDLDFEFQITDSMTTVNLVCELRAKSGEAWFEVDSLRVVQVKE
jgi:spore coat protein H